MNRRMKHFIIALIAFVILEAVSFTIIATATRSSNDRQQKDNMEKPIIQDRTVQQEENTTDNYELYDIPENSGFKSFMDYRMITDVTSKQYILQSNYASTGNYGIRMVSDRYCVAVGSYFSANIGQYLDIILENGTVIPCIMADLKADVDTDDTNIITMHNGCLSEFIVDMPELDNTARLHGDISYCSEDWDSPVASIKVYTNMNVFEFD